MSEREITELLKAHRSGDEPAFDELVARLYDDLRRLARQQLRRNRRGLTLDTTSIVNEAYMRLVDERGVDWNDRCHFFAIASRTMRRILIDNARKTAAEKRGGDLQMVTLDEWGIPAAAQADALLDLDRALEGLSQFSERQAQVVEYRFFGGLSAIEIAELLGVTTRTVERDWAKAKAWLMNELAG